MPIIFQNNFTNTHCDTFEIKQSIGIAQSNTVWCNFCLTECVQLDRPANGNSNVENGYSNSPCVVSKQISYDCWCYCGVTALSNANDCSQQHEYHKVLQKYNNFN